MRPRLFHLTYSPWSERARWALDYTGIEYDAVEHLPLFGEVTGRVARRQVRGVLTVPALVTDAGVFADSLAIVRWAHERNPSAGLFPATHHSQLLAWHERAEQAASAGRALAVAALLRSEPALVESVPEIVRPPSKAMTVALARLGARSIARKYGAALERESEHEATLRTALLGLREGLSGGAHLLGSFTWADIVMATLLQFIRPVDNAFLRLGPATREAWSRPALAGEFPDLLRWRDDTYVAFRRPRTPGNPSVRAA